MHEPAALLRVAGSAALLIIPFQIAAGVAFWLFLSGAGTVFGPLNDVLVAISLGLLLQPVLAIRSLAAPQLGPWFDVMTGLAVAGLVLASVGQLLLVAGLIPLGASFVTAGVGILPVLAWALAVAVVAGRIDALPDQLAWATAALLVAIVVEAVAAATLPPAGILVASVVLLAALTGWLLVLGWTCLSAVPGHPLAVSA